MPATDDVLRELKAQADRLNSEAAHERLLARECRIMKDYQNENIHLLRAMHLAMKATDLIYQYRQLGGK